MKLRFFVLFSLLFGCMLFTSCSYAWTFDEFLYFANTIKGENSNQTKAINTLIQYQDNVRAKIGNVNFTSFVCTNPNPNGGYCEFHFYLNPLQINSNNGQTIGFTYTDSNSANRDNLFSINYSTGAVTKTQWQSTNSWSVSSAFGLVKTSNNFTNWGNSYFNNKYVPPYTGPVFTPSNNGTIQVIASNGVSENMIRLPFTYTGQNEWTLGYLSDYDNVYSIFGYFGPLFYRDGQLYTESYQNQFTYNYYYGTNNNGLIFDPSTGLIAIKKEKLLNKQGYSLLLEYRLKNGDSLEDIGDYNYYAYFFNLSLSSGDLVSPDINTSVDIGMLNALDDFFSSSSGDLDSVNYNINELLNFSGDLFSGDLFSGEIFNKIGYKDYYSGNDYSLTLYDFYRRIIGVLLDDSTSSYIEFEYRGNTYRYYSSDFKTPDSLFKTFISGFIIVLFSIGIVKRLAALFKRMAILDYVGISSSFDVDDSNFL